MARRKEEVERERRLLAAVERIKARAIKPPRRPTLPTELGVEPPPSPEELRDAVRREYSGAVVSMVLALVQDGALRPPSVVRTVLHSMRHEALLSPNQCLETLSRDGWRALEEDLAEIEWAIVTGSWEPARTIVVLRSDDELSMLVGLPMSLADRLVIDSDPYVMPLERALEDHPPVLVADVHREVADLWTYRLGYRRELERVKDFVPTDTVDRSRPGKVQRHRRAHLRHHLREAARLAEQAFSEQGGQGIVVVGETRVAAKFREELPPRLRARVIGVLPPRPPEEIGREIDEMLAREGARREEEAVEQLMALRTEGLVASGLREVLDAVSRFIVRRLVLAEGPSRPGWACPHHHALALRRDACPYCGEVMRPVSDLTEELVEMGHRFGVDHLLVTQRPELLEPFEGIAAALHMAPTTANLRSSAARG